MNKPNKERLKRALGYSAFSLVATILFLYLTFPWDTLRTVFEEQGKLRLSAALGTPVELAVGDMQPSWVTGVVVKKAILSVHDPKAAADAAPQSMMLPELRYRLHLGSLVKFIGWFYLPKIFSEPVYSGQVYAKLPSGEIAGDIDLGLNKQASLASLKLDATIKGVDLAKSHDLLEMAGAFLGANLGALDLAGVVNVKADLSIKGGGLGGLEGTLTAGIDDGMIKGGKIGELDLPQIALGKLDMALAASPGKLDVKKLTIQSDDVDVTSDACFLTLNVNQFGLSSPHGKLKVHFGTELLKRIPYLSLGLNSLKQPDHDGNYTLPLGGTLKNPRLM